MSVSITPYLCVPQNLWVDQAKSFLSAQFKISASLGCSLVHVSLEAHWSLIAERYHVPLRRIAKRLSFDHQSAPLSLILDYADLAMPHKIGPEVFTPVILAFGAQHKLPIGKYDQMPQTVTNRIDLMTTSSRD